MVHRAVQGGRMEVIRRLFVLTLLAPLAQSLALAGDAPVITISREAMGPQQIEVHVGEQVRWRTPTGERLRIEFDAHRGAHEVVVRQDEVQAVFLGEGVHWYTGSVVSDGERLFRGVVVVKTAEAPVDPPQTCGPESSYRVCFTP